MSLTLKIQIVRINQLKAMKFAPTMSVSEACATVLEKTNEGGDDHGLFQPAGEGKRGARWLRMDRTLQFYDLKMNDTLEYKKKHRPLKVKLLDDTVKTMIVDDSMSVEQLVEVVGKKMNIKNFEEFSLQTEKSEGGDVWLNGLQSLQEQGVTEEQVVVLKKKFFVEDANISRDDPVQLHLVYVQSRDAIVSGSHPSTFEELIQFAALQCQIQLGSHNPAIHKPGFLKNKAEYLPPSAQKNKNAEKDIINEYRKLVGMSEVNAKYRYVQLCRSLKTYGITFFKTKERLKGQKKLIPKLLGITRDSILRLDFETREVEHEYPLTHLRRWAASPGSFTLDFGDYEEEYVSVITNEGESISQLLAGYIDILLKKRKDTGTVLEENGNDVATVESQGRMRGQAGVSITTSSVGMQDSSTGREGQFTNPGAPMARKGPGAGQGLQVTNVDTAQTAIANFINELDAQPLPVPGAVSNLSPQQWRQQLQISSKGVAAAAGKLGSLGVQPQNMDRTALNNIAKELAMTVDNMLQSARNAAASEGENPDGEMPLLDGAKAVAEAVAKMMKVTKDLSNNPTDAKSKEAFKNANELFASNMSLLNGAMSGNLADVAASRLIAESARAVAVAANGLLSCAKDVAEDLQLDPTGQQKLLNAAQAAQNASQNCLAISQTLAPAVLDPSCKRMIIDSAKAVQSANAQLLSAYQSIGTDLEGVGLADAARAVSEAIAQLMGSTEVAEPRSGADPDFADAAKAITENAAMLAGAQGNVPVIQHSAKAIAEAMPLLIAGAKRAAQHSDDEGVKQRLLQCAKQVSDAVKGLTELAAASAAAPNDPVAFARLQEASQRVAQLTHQLVGDSGKEAALQALRTTAKQAAAATTGLVAAARTAATSIDSDTDAAPLLAAAKLAADAIAKLIKPLQDAQKATDASPELIANLLNAAKQVAPVGYKLVATSKQAAPHITSKAKKEDLIFAANLAGEALKTLAATTAGAQGAAGDTNFDQSLEQFSAMVADLESAVMDAQTGNLEAAPGSKENALELMNVSVQRLVGAAKNLVGAKNNPDQLGPRAADLANAVQQVVNSGKAIAGINTNRAIQRNILNATKNVATQSEALVGCARALSSNPKDAGLSQAMSNAAKAVADAVAQFATAAKSADPTSKEIEDALNAVRGAEALLNPTPVKTNGDFAVLSEKLLASSKAVAAAVDQLPKVKSNPKEVAGLARSIAVIVPDLVQATNSVAGTAPNKETGQSVIQATKILTGELANLLNAARNAAGKSTELDPEGGNLNSAAKSVSEALRDLMAKLERTTPAQKEISLALQDVRDAVRKLDDPQLASIGAPLEAITHAAKGLADSVAQIISARDSPEKMSENARKASGNLGTLVESSKYAAAQASGQIKPGIPVLARQAQEACMSVANMAAAPKQDENTRKQIITAARQAALATSALVSAARDASAAAKPSNPEDSRAITNAAQSVATVAGKLVNCAKEAAANNPIDKQETARALKELADAVNTLLSLSSKAPVVSEFRPESLSPAASNLVEAVRATGTATVQLMEASVRAAGGARDTPTFATMSTAAKSVTSGIQALLNAANGLKPGQKELDAAIEAIQTASVELDAAALNAAIGLLENTAPPGATLQKAQEDLVEAAKELANGVKDVVTSAKSSPEKLGAAAKATGTTVPKLANIAKQCAGLTTDNAVQQEQLSAAKALTDCLLELLTAAKNGNMNELATQAKNASQAIGAIITPIKPGVMGSKECDDAMANIRDALADLGKPPPKPTRSYHECQAEMNNVSKSLVSALNTLVTTAKSKPEEVGLASKKVAAVIPPLIELTRLAAAASTDAEAKQRLPDGTRDIVNAALNVINDAKLVAGDRKNPQLQNALGASFKNITTAVGQFVSALKAAPASEKDIDTALEAVARTMAELDTAALFAAAGQLEADTTAYPTLEACQNGLLNASKAIAQAVNGLVEASKSGNPDQLGGHAKALAQSLAQLSKIAKATACIAGDSVSQQSLLTSARACSIAGQQLVLSARQAQKSRDPTDQTALSGSASAVSQAVESLIAFAQTASAESSKGIVELDNVATEIRKMLGAFDNSFKGNPQATPEDIVNAAKQVAEATALLVFACNNSPEDIAAATKNTGQSTKALLENAKGAIRLTDDAVIQSNLLDAAKAVANSTAKLVNSAKQQRADVQNPVIQQKLSAASTDVIDTIDQIVGAAGDLPGGERAKKLYAAGENLEETAEKELLAAAQSIDSATQVLLAAKKQAQEKRELAGLLTTGVDEAILDAARAIAQATHVLVNNATVCQKEIVVAGKSSKTTSVYRRDPTWARGLISAAHAVAGAVQVLVGNASEVAQGKTEEEALVTAARGVAGATARLVSASRAKADPMSTAQQKLSGAAKTVANATSELVLAAKAVGEIEAEEAPLDLSEKTGMQTMTEKFQTEVEIMQLQKALAAKQRRLGDLNQAEYQKDKVPPPPTKSPAAAKATARPLPPPAKPGSPSPSDSKPPATQQRAPPATHSQAPAGTPPRAAPDAPARQAPPAMHSQAPAPVRAPVKPGAKKPAPPPS